MITNLPTQKRCTICGEVKSAREFHRQREPNGTYRLVAACKPCANADTRDRLRHTYRTDPAYRARCLARARHAKRARSVEYQIGRAWTGQHVRRLLDRLLAAGWRQGEIARVVGVSGTVVSNWVRGVSVPRYPRHVAALRQLAEKALPNDGSSGSEAKDKTSRPLAGTFVVPCACGCGQEIVRHLNARGVRKHRRAWLPGHFVVEPLP